MFNVPPFPASVTAEGAQLNVPPFPASVTAEGRQFNGAPSLWERVRVRGFVPDPWGEGAKALEETRLCNSVWLA